MKDRMIVLEGGGGQVSYYLPMHGKLVIDREYLPRGEAWLDILACASDADVFLGMLELDDSRAILDVEEDEAMACGKVVAAVDYYSTITVYYDQCQEAARYVLGLPDAW